MRNYYVVETLDENGAWWAMSYWSLYPGQFREFLSFVNGSSTSCGPNVIAESHGPELRVRRCFETPERFIEFCPEKHKQ